MKPLTAPFVAQYEVSPRLPTNAPVMAEISTIDAPRLIFFVFNNFDINNMVEIILTLNISSILFLSNTL